MIHAHPGIDPDPVPVPEGLHSNLQHVKRKRSQEGQQVKEAVRSASITSAPLTRTPVPSWLIPADPQRSAFPQI